jgi:AcrR family transcriptional regulator
MAAQSTREMILEAALVEFDENGYEVTTVARICERASVSNGSFFHAYPSKEALSTALFVSALGSYHDALTASVEKETAAADGVSALVRTHIDWVIRNRAMARFMFERPRAGQSTEGLGQQAAVNDRFRRKMAKWFEPHIRDGALYRYAPDILVSQIIGPAQLFCRAWLSGRSKEKPNKYTPQLIECVVRAIVLQPN